MKKAVFAAALLAAIALIPVNRPAYAGLPLLNIDGDGGGAIVPWAYLSNPAGEGMFGKPAFSAWRWSSDDYTFDFLGVALTVANRVEFGLAYQRADVDDLRDDLKADSAAALGGSMLDLGEDDAGIINAHAKVLLLKETDNWPAVAFSVTYKNALDVDDIDDSLTAGARAVIGAGAPRVLDWMGVDDDDGFEFNLMATKLWKTEIPILTSINLRYTQAVQLGFLGFSDHWSLNPEVTLAILPKPNLAVGVEYRQKPDELDSLNDYLGANAGARFAALEDYSFEEDAFIDFFVSYQATPKLSISGGVADIGNVFHRKTRSIWAVNLNYGF